MEYRIAEAGSIVELTLEVNKLIRDGFVPQGGVCYHSLVEYGTLTRKYSQAMVKHENA